MAIGDLTALPLPLQNAVQQNLLAKGYLIALQSVLAYSRESGIIHIPSRVGATYTFTKLSELPVSRLALDPTTISNLDDGLSSDAVSDEQFTFKLSNFARTFDINILQERAMIADYTMNIVKSQGKQAARTREAIARYNLFNSYAQGNTIVTNHTVPSTTTCHVDDLRGLGQVMANGSWVSVSSGAGLQLQVNDLTNTAITLQITGVTPDSTSATPETDAANLSSSKTTGGISGMIVYQTVATAPTAGDILQATNASVVLRPNGKQSTQALAAGDLFNLMQVMQGKQQLHQRGVEAYDDGFYRCIIPPQSMTHLFADPDFKQAATGMMNSPEFRFGKIIRYQGVEFIETTEAIVQAKGAGIVGGPSAVNVAVARPILLGKGAIVRGDSMMMDEFVQEQQANSMIHDSQFLDGIQYVIRSPLDRLGQIMASSWQMITSYTTPSDVTTTTAFVPTADNAAYKKAVLFEHSV